jgi:hypothetical protein
MVCSAITVAAAAPRDRRPSMITSKPATNDHPKTGHHEVTETGSV